MTLKGVFEEFPDRPWREPPLSPGWRAASAPATKSITCRAAETPSSRPREVAAAPHLATLLRHFPEGRKTWAGCADLSDGSPHRCHKHRHLPTRSARVQATAPPAQPRRAAGRPAQPLRRPAPLGHTRHIYWGLAPERPSPTPPAPR